MFSIRFYRMYDAGKEIDLGELAKELDRRMVTRRISFQLVKPKSIHMEEPPLQLELQPLDLEQGGEIFHLEVVARIYEIGAISLCFCYSEQKGSFSRLEEIGLKFSGQKDVGDHFLHYCRLLQEIVRAWISDFVIDTDLYEDYTIYVTDQPHRTIDPLPLLSGERIELSTRMREEIMKNSLSYAGTDLVVISWDSALVSALEPPTDLLDLLEYAIVQLVELRYYDRLLTRQMAKMYDDIEKTEPLSWWLRLYHYRRIMAELMRVYADLSEITEKVNNLIKVTEDIYYARVYATALKVFRVGEWADSVQRKIEVIRENYTMLSDEVRNQHSNFLEWLIIILIAFEIAMGIWRGLQ